MGTADVPAGNTTVNTRYGGKRNYPEIFSDKQRSQSLKRLQSGDTIRDLPPQKVLTTPWFRFPRERFLESLKVNRSKRQYRLPYLKFQRPDYKAHYSRIDRNPKTPRIF